MKYRIDPDKVVWRTIDGEDVILSLDIGHCYGLNKTGSFAWNMFVEKRIPQEVSERFFEKFKISSKIAGDDIRSLVTRLEKEALLLKEKEES